LLITVYRLMKMALKIATYR